MIAVETVAALGYIITFVLGLSSGLVIETIRFAYLRKKDNWTDLKNPLQDVYGVIRNLQNDCDHAFKIQNHSSSSVMDEVLNRINQNLGKYLEWFKPFEDHLGIKKVDSIDEVLGATLIGISNFARLSKQDQRYVESRLDKLREITEISEKRMEEFIKAKMPLNVIFRKRRLENWRNSRF
jgi:hypothetical protein